MEYEKIRDELLTRVNEDLTEKRRIHTLAVRDLAVKMAEIYGADPLKAEIAALGHDLYRGLRGEELNNTVRELGLDEKYLDDPNLAHSKIAAVKLRTDFGVTDQEILDAVSYHTTGRRGMGLLEKIIFLADATEPNRSHPGVEEVREAALRNLDEGCLRSMEGTIAYVRNQGAYLDENTLEAQNFLKENK